MHHHLPCKLHPTDGTHEVASSEVVRYTLDVALDKAALTALAVLVQQRVATFAFDVHLRNAVCSENRSKRTHLPPIPVPLPPCSMQCAAIRSELARALVSGVATFLFPDVRRDADLCRTYAFSHSLAYPMCTLSTKAATLVLCTT